MKTFGSARARLWKLLLLAAGLMPGSLFAQLITDEVPRGRTVPTLEQIRQDVGKSRLRLGPIRLIPTVKLSDAGYEDNVFGAPERDRLRKIADWSATVTAGTRWIVPLGSKIYLRGEALPSYTWYQKLSHRRTFGGLYRTSVLGFFNKVSLEAGGYAQKGFEFLPSEIETRVVQNVGQGSADLELELSPRLSLFGQGEIQSLRFRLPRADPVILVNFARFDRTDGAVRSGIRYRLSPIWDISAAVEQTRTGFVRTTKLDNESVAYLGGIHYSRPRLFVNLFGGYRTGGPYDGSRFPKYSTTTGSYFVSYFLTRNVEPQLYGGRRIIYSLGGETPYFIQTRNGGRLNIQVQSRLFLHGYGEFGTHQSPFRDRTDNFASVGGGFSVSLFRGALFTALADRATYSSSKVPGLERSVLRFTTGLSFEGELSR